MSALLSKLCLSVTALFVAAGLAACGGSTSTSSSGHQSRAQNTGTSGGSSSATATTPAATSSASTTSTSTASPPVSAASGCPTSSLHLSFVSGQGAAGTAYMTYALTNLGAGTCTLYGYPGVAILDAAGQIVQHPAQRGGIQARTRLQLVTLPRGAQARFIVTSSDVIPSPGCQHVFTGTTLQVFPPGQRVALRLPHSGSFCNLHVGPVQISH